MDEVASRIAKAGMTAQEAADAMEKIGGSVAAVMREEMNEMAKRRGITFEEAESIYLGRLSRLSGKRGRVRQWWVLRKVRKYGGFNY